MMESIVQVVKGDQIDKPSDYTCEFCSKSTPASQLFGVTVVKKHSGVLLKLFGVCDDHLHRLNAMLSGEFDIDEIYLDRFRKGARKVLKVRGHPALLIAETKNKKTQKECSFPGCTNRFYGIATRKYCSDERCIEMRKIAMASIPRKRMRDPDADNIILPKAVSTKIKKGRVLHLRCRARDKNGCRCTNTFTTIFEPQKHIYPKYCPEHRTSHRRQRFSIN